jgi:restriction endonuclease S subunit
MPHLPLGEIARVRVGFQFRSEAPYSPLGNHHLIQLRDSKEILPFEEYETHRVDCEEIRKEDLLSVGDILLRAKGKNHFAVCVTSAVENLIAGAACLIIRPLAEQITSGYLAWYLNQPPAQAFLNKISAGTSIPVVNKKALLDLEVSIPPRKIQNAIGELYQLQLSEEELTQKITRCKRSFLNAQMLRASQSENGVSK